MNALGHAPAWQPNGGVDVPKAAPMAPYLGKTPEFQDLAGMYAGKGRSTTVATLRSRC